jgi:hypothetical protein
LHYEGLSQLLLEFAAEQTRQDVGASFGRERHDERNRVRRIVTRSLGTRHRSPKRRQGRQCQGKQRSTRQDHCRFSIPVGLAGGRRQGKAADYKIADSESAAKRAAQARERHVAAIDQH